MTGNEEEDMRVGEGRVGGAEKAEKVEREQMEEGEELIDGEAAVMEVELTDGRLEAESATTSARLAVQQVEAEKHLVMVQLTSNHYAFSLKRSTVTRSVDSFYQLSSILKSHHPWLSVPSLPLRPSLWVSSFKWRNQQLCSWLASILASPQFLSSRALHLFLQTSHSINRIQENIEGRRDDQVVPDKEKVLGDTRNNNREGFRGVFGGLS